MPSALDELESLQATRTPPLSSALARLMAARLRGSIVEQEDAERELAEELVATQAAAAVLGGRRLLLEVGLTSQASTFALVPFVEALESVIERIPALARTWREARDLYERGAFAVVRSASEIVTVHLQRTIAQAVQLGQPRDVVVNELAEILGARQLDERGASFVRSYADTVFRTTTTSAYAEGRVRQADDPAVRRVIGAWRYDATNDGDVRPNHIAGDGFMAALDDPVWRVLRPPLGFNCRCALAPVPRQIAVQRGVITSEGSPIFVTRIPAGFGPDAGFRKDIL